MSTQVYRHDLTGKLEAALRSSNAQVSTYILGGPPNTVVPYGDGCAVVVVVQFEQVDILNRVGVRLLEPSAGEDGWDVRACGAGRGCSRTSGAEHQLLWCGRLSACPQVFSLDYQVEAPVSAVIHSEASDAYSRLFHLLWRVKRIEWSLAASWK